MWRIWERVQVDVFSAGARFLTSLCMTFPMASGAAIGLLTGVAKSVWRGWRQRGVDEWSGWRFADGGRGGGDVGDPLPDARGVVMYMVVALINCATMAILWLGPLTPCDVLRRSDAIVFHDRRLLCHVYGGGAGVFGSLRQERQRTVFHHQFAGKCARALYAASGWVGC